MKNNEPTNKKEIHAAIVAAYKAVAKLEELITPEVKAWAYEAYDVAYDNRTDAEELVVDIMNIGQNLVDIGTDLDSDHEIDEEE